MTDLDGPLRPKDEGICVYQGRTIDEVYQQLRESFQRNPGMFLLNVCTRVDKPERIMPDNPNASEEDIKEAVQILTDDNSEIDFFFMHKSRISHYGSEKLNQFDLAAKALGSTDDYTSENAVAFFVNDPLRDFAPTTTTLSTPPPFFCLGQFTKDVDGRIGVTGFYRWQEMSAWWIANIWELLQYRDDMIQMIHDKYQIRYRGGPIVTMAAASHWRQEQKPLVKIADFDRPTEAREIPRLLSQIFEDHAEDATTRMAELIDARASLTTEKNSPARGLSTLNDALSLMQLRWKDKDPDLFDKIHRSVAEAIGLNDELQKVEPKGGTADRLGMVLGKLAQVFRNAIPR